VRPGDVAILFRTRESHREFEGLRSRGGRAVRTSTRGSASSTPDEIKDLLAVLWYSRVPSSDLRAAAFLPLALVRLPTKRCAAGRPARQACT
jgi:ATP-dependent exoDNAse (exonuclease V) beta subunit